ncbi:PKD domain-containing protein [Dactylosporangium sp. NPDC051484]|uniref:PKD domain-containing protein n=1 Tax=Dactylosporangium sp. NPDC051484 TaxID=3154942 RepID=UPI00344EFF12
MPSSLFDVPARAGRWLVAAFFGGLFGLAVASSAATAAEPPTVAIDQGGSHRYFSPNGDAQSDELAVYYCLAAPANVTVTVEDAAGTRVRTVESDVSHPGGAPCYGWNTAAVWDGRGDGGTVVADGVYTLRVHAVDGTGQTGDDAVQVGVDTRTPGAITAPAPASAVSGTLHWTFTPAAGVGVRNVNAYCDGTDLGYAATANPDGTFSGAGDTTLCTAGANQIGASVSWTDPFGNPQFWVAPAVPVSVTNPPRLVIDQDASHRYFTIDGDGQQDTAFVYYCLSRSGPVTMSVANATGAVVRTTVLDGSGSPTCYGWNAAAEWDGRDDGGALVADGVYTVRLRTADPDGQAAEDTVTVGVDQHGPGALTEPAGGATLSGTVDWVFTPAPGHTVDSVQVYCDGASGSSNGLSGSIDTTACVGGPTTVNALVLWTDPFGAQQYWTAPPVHVTIDNAPTLKIWQEPSHRYFSPNGDTQDDALAIYYCLSAPAEVTATVTDGAGAVVRTIAGPPFPGRQCSGGWNATVTWDGRTDAGAVAADGVYTVRLRAVDGGGRAVEDSVTVGVEAGLPGTLTSPTPQAAVEGPFDWVFTPTAGVGVTDVTVYCDGPGYATVRQPSADGAFRGRLDSTACPDGTNQLRTAVTWRDPFGAYQTWYGDGVPITVDNAPRLTISQQASQRYFSPNGDGYEDTIAVQYCLSTDAVVRLTVTDATGAVRRTKDVAQQHGYPVCYGYTNNALEWDGRDAAGAVVANGVYTVRVTATTAGGRTAEDSVQVGVDARSPGGVTVPTPGAVLTGLATAEFRPADGFQLSQVDFYLNTGGGSSAFNPSPDGVWRTTFFTGGLVSGPAVLQTRVRYQDAFGADHSWYAPQIPVVIDATSVPLSVTAEPARGPAPLATTLKISASEPTGRALAYRVDFSDGTAVATGQIAAPYDPLSLAHTYTQPGVYRAYITVTGPSGAAASKTVDVAVSSAANTAPSATLTAGQTRGVAPLTVQLGVAGSDREGDALTYTLDFGDGTTDHGALPHAAVTHTYVRAGTFVARLTVSDGRLSTYRTVTFVVAPGEPLIADAGDDVNAVVDEPVRFDGGGSRPSLGIESYQWAFGDGGSASGVVADHTYTREGTYTATLTVRSAAETSTDTLVVTVKQKPAEEGLVVTVTGGGAPLPGASVMLVDASGARTSAATDADGKAHLNALGDGTYTVYAWQAGYLPGTGTGTVTDGSGTTTVNLTTGQVAETSLTSQPLTKDEIVAAGIDPDDPGNQRVYQFSISLAINTEPVKLTGYASPGGFPLCPDANGADASCSTDRRTAGFTAGGYDVSVSVTHVREKPQLVWLVMPAKASWLKEFFSVQLAVTNLAGPDFSLDGGVATLTLPAGLTLAPTTIQQHATVAVPDVSGGHSATTAWLVRGDKEGFYDLNATYAATLSPFGEPVTVDARTIKPVHVWGGSAVTIIVDAEQDIYNRYPYRVRVGLKNVADVPIYNAAVQMTDQHSPHYLRQPGQALRQETARIEPGAIFWADDFIFAPDIDGELNLGKSFVAVAGGAGGPAAVVTKHPALSDPDHGPQLDAVGLGMGVGLKWTPVPGATGYEIYQTPDLNTEFPTTPVATLPAGVTRAAIPLPKGGSGWFAVSAIINGKRTMVHPIQEGETSALPAAPTVQATVSSTASCDQDVTVTAHFSDEFFGLTGYTATLDGVEAPVGQGPLSGNDAVATFTIKTSDLTSAGARLRITATDDAPETGPEWSTTVGSGCNPIRMLVLGDSIAWGQGLAPNHKYPELVKDALHQQSGRPVEYTDAMNVSHSGAFVHDGAGCAPGLRATAGYYGGEVPTSSPDIGVCQAQQVRDKEADVILVDGCINDVGVDKILNPLVGLQDLRDSITQRCGAPVEQMLRTLHSDHPEATIIYTGYYPIFDRGLVAAEQLVLADRLGKSRDWLRAVADLGANTLIERSATFDRDFRNLAQQHVAALDPNHTWLHFVDPGFGPGDGLFDADSKLFSGLDDEVVGSRVGACLTVFQFAPCPIASIGHPNRAGARRYADAIMGRLTTGSARLTGISVAPVTVAKGRTQQLNVTAVYSDGSTRDAGALVTATSKSTTIATVDPTTLQVTGVAKGKTTITVTLGADPAIKATAQVEVTAPDVASVSLSPPTPNVLNGKTVRLTAVLTMSDGTTKNASNAKVTWTSGNPATATVSDAGVVKGLFAGQVWITAAYREDAASTPMVASTLVTVSPAAPTITDFSPYGGYEGAVVTVEGTDFLGATSVTLGGVEITQFTVVSSTTITFVAPPNARTGYITVTTPLGTARSVGRFSFVT